MVHTDLGRIRAFTDGVMAVAITLLVLNIEVPGGSDDELGERLVDLLPSLGAYALSFALVGRFWIVHHRLFESLRAIDGTLMALNLVFLAFLALIPFSTDLVDEYPEVAVAAAVFGLNLALVALAHWSMTAYTLRRNFVHDHHRAATQPFGGPLALGFTGVFLVSVPVAFLSTHAAQALWVATIVLRYPLRWASARRSQTSE